MRRGILWVCALAFLPSGPLSAADGNRLTYLDESDPYYVSRDFPKLVTPQWIGEDGVEAVVVLAIDDMRGHPKWEEYLRPILDRLKQIDGRAPVSIMTNRIDPAEPHLQVWLKEGLSLEVHTIDHPCPLLQGGDFAKAKSTYDRCIDQMDAIPGNRAVAFRMPCCDSLNTPSPRFFAEIFNRTTEAGNYLEIDSSVFNITTAGDPALPRALVLDEQGCEIYRKYVPFKSFVNTVEDYPYPYVVGRLCWEFPCVVPSDWEGQRLQKPNNPRTVQDMELALDAAVAKQGSFNLVFHPHGWIRSEQVIQLIDHAVKRYGGKVKFLTFREALDRLNKHLLAGQSLRGPGGQDNGARLIDLNGDGYLDVVIGNDELQQTRIWSPRDRRWAESGFPTRLVAATASGNPQNADARFGISGADGAVTLLSIETGQSVAWRFADGQWKSAAHLTTGLTLESRKNAAEQSGSDRGVRLRDLDGDGRSEVLVSNPDQQAAFRWDDLAQSWKRLPFALPGGATLVDAAGRDAGLRFADVDEDGHADVVFSNEDRFALYLWESPDSGWSRKLLEGRRGEPGTLPMISRLGTNNGVWFHSRHLWVQNEDTNRLPDLVDRRSFDELLGDTWPGPKSPQASLNSMRARPSFAVELVAAEPLVLDPIAFAWGADGKFWVVEMGDYPLGVDGQGKPGGQIRCLEDSDGDGKYDKATVFLDGLGFPTGVAPWRQGVLVCCAPDLFYAADTDGDGRADTREVLFTGFGEGNQQHRMNGLKWGMDGWLYGANGDSGGKIKCLKTGTEVNISGRDFRIRPDQGILDPQAGSSQFGRSRDDWDHWFGCTNSNPMYQFVLDDHYLRRNPHVPAPDGRVNVSETPGPAPVFPRSRTLSRFNNPTSANRFTSANSVIVYRDDLFGPEFAGNSFVSEPVHNLVHREVMTPTGLTFTSRRATGEAENEFLTSTDNWFRPAMIETGPDGRLWVADMYRQTIEHPQWIPAEWQKKLDLRAGHDRGRIYSVYPVGTQPRPIPRLDRLPIDSLVAALDSPSGWQRDTAEQLLLWRRDPRGVPLLVNLASGSQRPICRAQALCSLDLLGGITPEVLIKALRDAHPGVRRESLRLAEPLLQLGRSPELVNAVLAIEQDTDPEVQLQWAYTLGQSSDPRAAAALGRLAPRAGDNRFMAAAVMSSMHAGNVGSVLAAVLDGGGQPPAGSLVESLIAVAIATGDKPAVARVLEKLSQPVGDRYAAWQLSGMVALVDALEQGGLAAENLAGSAEGVARVMHYVRSTSTAEGSPDEDRVPSIRLLGRTATDRAADVELLFGLIVPQTSGAVQSAAIEAIGRQQKEPVAERLLDKWRSCGPSLRSQMLDVLLSRAGWTQSLLAALESKQVLPGDIDAAHRQRLMGLKDAKLRAQAERLLAGAVNADRQKVVQQFQSVLSLAGDTQSGGAVFAKRCAGCHQLRGVGHAVGPDLASLTDNSSQFLLSAVLDPNRAVEAKFVDYLAVTNDGLLFTGILVHESGGSITLLSQDGKQRVLLRRDLDSLQSSGKSLMPEGLEKDTSEQDFANLFAFVRGSGPPPKTIKGNQPAMIQAAADGSLKLLATNCEIYGSSLVLESRYQNLGYWSSENDRAVWAVELVQAGKYRVRLHYACALNVAGNSYRLEAGSSLLTGTTASTGSWDTYRQIDLGTVDLMAGRQKIVFRSAGPIRGALVDLSELELTPVTGFK